MTKHSEELVKKPDIVNKIKARELKYYGHLRRHDSTQRDLLVGYVDERRLRFGNIHGLATYCYGQE